MTISFRGILVPLLKRTLPTMPSRSVIGGEERAEGWGMEGEELAARNAIHFVLRPLHFIFI